MNYLAIDEFDVANGPGVRVTLWLSGCDHHCKGCHNPESWDFNVGKPFGEAEINNIKQLLKNPYIKGLTLTGGDPIYHSSNETLLSFLKDVKNDYKDKTIWCYTGFTFEQLSKNLRMLQYIDVLVDGPFEIDKRDITLKFKGSSNQRIIDVQESLLKGEVVLWEN